MLRFVFLVCLIFNYSFSNEKLNLQLNGLDIKEFISISSKVLNKNIFFPDDINGSVNFVSNKKVDKKDLFDILKYVLDLKGFDLQQENDLLKVVKKQNSLTISKEESIDVIYLNNTNSKDILTLLENIKKKSKYSLSISANKELNSIVLMGLSDQIKIFRTLIKKLDIQRKQVYVQAKIIEVSEVKTLKTGLEYGLDGFNKYNKGLVGFSSSLNSAGVVSSIKIDDLKDFGYDITSMKNGITLGVSLNLLSKNGAADVISEPSILCINNKEGSIYVGETRSIKTATTITNAGVINETYKREDIGLTLKIKPRVSKENRVFLNIETKIEDIGQTTTNEQPNTTKKELITSAIVNNGESVILGGYIKSRVEKGENKVPFFGNLPLLGNLFKNNIDINDKINLVIVVTPYIIPPSKDITYIRQNLIRLKRIEDKYTKSVEDNLEKLKVKKEDESIDELDYKRLHEQRLDEILGN